MAIPEKVRMNLLNIKSLAEECLGEQISAEKLSQLDTMAGVLQAKDLPALYQWLQGKENRIKQVLFLKNKVKAKLDNVDLPINRTEYSREENVVVLQLDRQGGFAIQLVRNSDKKQDLDLYYHIHPYAYGYDDSDSLEVVDTKILRDKLNEEQLDLLIAKLGSILSNPQMVDYYFWEDRLLNKKFAKSKHQVSEHGLKLVKAQGGWCKKYLYEFDKGKNIKELWEIGIDIDKIEDRYGKIQYFAFFGTTEDVKTFEQTFLIKFADQPTILGSYEWGGDKETNRRWKDVKDFMKLDIMDREDLPFNGQDIKALEKQFDVAIEIKDKRNGQYYINIAGPQEKVMFFKEKIVDHDKKIMLSGFSSGPSLALLF